MTESGLQQKFRLVLLKIGLGLTRKNIKSLDFICKLQPELTISQDTDGLDILKLLLLRGEFDENEPEKLREILEQIGRKDLSEIVNKEYMKSSVYKEYLKEKKKKDVSPFQRKRSTIVPMHIPPMTHDSSNDKIIARIEKLLESMVDTFTIVCIEFPKAAECITTMQESLADLKKLTKDMKREQAFPKRMPMSLHGQEAPERSNSLDSKTRPKISKKMQEPHLYAIMPVPASVIAEYHQKLEDQRESHSNTSSGSSIASNESNDETQNLKGQAIDAELYPRYVTVNKKNDHEKDKAKEHNAGKMLDAKNDHVYDDPDRNRAYVNFSILPSDDSAKPQECASVDTHNYENVSIRTPITQHTQ